LSKDREKGNLARFLGFCKRTALFAVLVIALSLAIWLGISLFQGRFGSPAGALFLGATLLFGLAMLPFFIDTGSTLILPLRVFILNKDTREILEQDRPRSETPRPQAGASGCSAAPAPPRGSA